MTADDIKELKTKLLAPLHEKLSAGAAAAQGAEVLKPETRLAVGHSAQANGQLNLEIRVQKSAGPAWRKAEELKKRYPNEVGVAVIESVEVPSAAAVLEHAPHSKALTGLPLRLGSSLSHEDGNAPGSLGAFVFDKDGELSVIGCSHVLALSGEVENRKRVVHPGVGDVRQLRGGNFVGKLSDYTAATKGKANALDAAYARLNEDIKHNGNVIPDEVGAPPDVVGKPVTHVPTPKALDRLTEGALLAKVGRTTGYTEGLLSAVGVDNVPVLVYGIGLVYFDNCIEVRWKRVNQAFTRPGDSGAVVFTAEGQEAIGLHFAGGDAKRDGQNLKLSYACDLAAILSTNLFGLTWS